MPFYRWKFEAIDMLEKTDLELSLVSIGQFLDYWAGPRIPTYIGAANLQIDAVSRTAIIPGDGKNPVVMTHSTDAAKFTVALLDLKSWKRRYAIIGNRLNLDEAVKLAEEVMGVTFDAKYFSIEDLEKSGIELSPSMQKILPEEMHEGMKFVLGGVGILMAKGNSDIQGIENLTVMFPNLKPLTARSVWETWNCQICRVDMAVARIRTPDEPSSAALNIDGANYVGWVEMPWVGEAKDQECQDCTTIDRTPTDQILQWESLPCWPEDDDPDDPNWLPAEHAPTDNEPFEHDSEYAQPEGTSNESDCESVGHNSLNEEHDGVEDLYLVSELCDQLRPECLTNGTWCNGKIYYTGNRQAAILGDFPGEGEHKAPPEHIASSSCQSLRGINGYRLSLGQMKNCRNVRFLIPKSKNWKSAVDERLMEEDSLFYLSGESNGSNVTEDRYFID
ncbi:unnamed protein product [Fusarium langsethiae]|nr:unnamed protein product [Fusarium langsethiae]